MNLVSPYRNIKQYTRISIEPYHMNSDIILNIKLILKKKKEKKCNNNGFIDEVYRILEYSDGMMPPENLNGCIIYNITYHCKICIPIENTLIIGQIKVINQELIIAVNGPIMIFIPKENIDSNFWDIIDGYKNKKNNKKLVTEDFVKIQITDKRINQNDNQIKSIGKLNELASDDEVNKFFGSKVNKSNEIETENILEDSNTIENTDTESNFII
jgi:DNA-directed RNA polymerase subunit E'/Rpb7